MARQLMRLADAEFSQRGIQYLVLHATEKGRFLYADLGWNGTTEMAKRFLADPDMGIELELNGIRWKPLPEGNTRSDRAQ